MRKHPTQRHAKGRKPLHRKDHTSEELTAHLLQFLEHHPPRRVSTNLRRMLLEFMMSEGAVEAMYLQDLLYDMEGLFELLEECEWVGSEGEVEGR